MLSALCGLKVNSQTWSSVDTIYNVVFTIKRKVPYCGGAAPSPEMVKRTSPVINANFIINYQEGYGDSLWEREFITDSTGKVRLNLPDGKYCLKGDYKNLPFDDFYKMHKKVNDNFNLYGDTTCYYKWWKSCNYIFEVTGGTDVKEIEVILMSRCFTGENPCHRYIGPYPP